MINVRHPRGHAIVLQADHAALSAQLADAWGNDRFGPFEPVDVVRLAAEQHDLGWADWDRSPTLDPSTGLPERVYDVDLGIHLAMQLEGPRKLARHSPYAGLLALLRHRSMYSRPPALGLLRADGRRLRSYLDRSWALQAELRAGLAASDAEIDRNWNLVRVWDELSLDLLCNRAPRTHRAVPAAGSTTLDVRVERRDGVHLLDPWPFADDRLRVHAPGRLLEETFSDPERMWAALAEARQVTLAYELVPA